jgi:hypothetical protein
MKDDLEFDGTYFDKLLEYLKKFAEYRDKKKFGFPDGYSDTILLVPFIMAMQKSQERLEKLTRSLIILTVILSVLTAVLVILRL